VQTWSGVFTSTDGGATWALTNAGIRNLRVSVLTMDPTDPPILYAGTTGGWSDAFLTKVRSGRSRRIRVGAPDAFVLMIAR
jgi:hypothetical protein